MEAKENNDDLIKEWQNRKYDFENIIGYDPNDDPFKFDIDNYLDRAGKLFFETAAKLDFSFTIPDEYKDPPIGKGLDENEVWCFREYWLCVLGLFARVESSFINYKSKLKKITLPEEYDKGSRWDCVQDESYLADVYFIRSKNYLKLICNASIKLCNMIINLYESSPLVIDKEKQTIRYQNQLIKLSGEVPWRIFMMLYDAKGGVVCNKDISNRGDHADKIRLLKNRLKTQNAQKIMKAIKPLYGNGYWLDLKSLQ
ncbi:MAG: hypothetical protein ACYC54_10455 [Sedimentisphaerales bacterium]